MMTHPIHISIGGWTYEPWRGVFYPEGLVQKRELEYAASKLTSIEINGTYYSTFKPDSWKKWRDETPDGFVFSVKASRYCTNRKVLSEGGESFDRFLSQGLTELGDRLGPINWQFMGTKKFDPEDFEGFLKLLPQRTTPAAAMRLCSGTTWASCTTLRSMQTPAWLRPRTLLSLRTPPTAWCSGNLPSPSPP